VVPDADHQPCRRELLAQTGSNLAASVTSGFACSGSFNRTSALGLGLCVPRAGVETTLMLAIVLVIVQLILNQSPSRPAEPPESSG
jgi:MFS superfamily sulfate permease-like transporter